MQMIPIAQLSVGKKVSIAGQSGKLWRWKRSHHQWLLQFKWKWQKPWKLSEMIRHSDETITRARPRPQLLPHKPHRVMWNRLPFCLNTNWHGLQIYTANYLHKVTLQLRLHEISFVLVFTWPRDRHKYVNRVTVVLGCKFPVRIEWDVNVEKY